MSPSELDAFCLFSRIFADEPGEDWRDAATLRDQENGPSNTIKMNGLLECILTELNATQWTIN